VYFIAMLIGIEILSLFGRKTSPSHLNLVRVRVRVGARIRVRVRVKS
jgi:hypothetical protein